VFGEQRTVPLAPDGTLRDFIDGFGVRVYEYPTAPPPDFTLAGNLVRNGSFEEQTNIGYPDYFHVSPGPDRAASWGTDPLEAHHGEHSLFIRCPADEQGPAVVAYPLTLQPGRYRASVWLKYDRPGGRARLQISGFANAPGKEEPVGPQWQPVSVDFEVPPDTHWVHIGLSARSRGVLWADELRVQPLPAR
jgi:hypothetical protein